jgi:4-hydroxy-tetrahydrodipicolinate synthase
LFAHFADIAAAVDRPLFLYDAPAATKNKIQPETVARLRSAIPHLVGIKVSDPDCVALQKLVGLMRNDGGFSILTGSEFLFHAALHMGCDGGVGGLYNVCPHMAVRLHDAFVAGDQGRAAELQRDLVETWQFYREGEIWGGFDEALRQLGICESASGAPYRQRIDAEAAARVRALIDRMVRPYF